MLLVSRGFAALGAARATTTARTRALALTELAEEPATRSAAAERPEAVLPRALRPAEAALALRTETARAGTLLAVILTAEALHAMALAAAEALLAMALAAAEALRAVTLMTGTLAAAKALTMALLAAETAFAVSLSAALTLASEGVLLTSSLGHETTEHLRPEAALSATFTAFGLRAGTATGLWGGGSSAFAALAVLRQFCLELVDFLVKRADFSLDTAQFLAAACPRAGRSRSTAADTGASHSTASAGAEARPPHTAAGAGPTGAGLSTRSAARAVRLGRVVRRGLALPPGSISRLRMCKIR